MGFLSNLLGYAATGLLAYIGYHSYKAYQEYKEDNDKKGE